MTRARRNRRPLRRGGGRESRPHERLWRLPKGAARDRLAAIVLACLPALFAACESGPRADLVLMNGHVVTVDESMPEAEAVAMAGDTIMAVGTAAQIDAYVGRGTEVIDVEGRLVMPAFIEGHGHYMSLGRAKTILDLTTARTWAEIVDMVAAAAEEAEPGEWIFGRGWHQEKWDRTPSPAVEGMAVHTSLSEVTPENPVLLGHASGHAAFANARAMELAGIDRDTPDPDGGTIVRDRNGNATGLLRETAQRVVDRTVAEWQTRLPEEERRQERRRMAILAGEEALAHGVTTFHDAGSDFETIDFFKELVDRGELPVRLYVMVRRESNDDMDRLLPEYRWIGYRDMLTVRSIKRQIDGALGAHGAWLLEPYEDLDTDGLVLEPIRDIARTAEIALKHDFQVNTHAIGDRANRETLDIYEKAFQAAGVDGAARRWRIEHAQHIDPADVPRFAELGVIAAMQAIHCTSDGPWVPDRLGEERARETSYPWRDLLDSGAVVTNGTDVPVEDIDPIAGFHASVTRLMNNGERFFPEQAMTREEALYSYTMANAYAAFEEDVKGSITPGKLADIVVLSKDIMTVPDDEILDAEVLYTVLGGRVAYRADQQEM